MGKVAFKDLREWITAVEKAGQLCRVKKQVDWKFELSTVLRRTRLYCLKTLRIIKVPGRIKFLLVPSAARTALP